jgi:hypothetical protein
MPPATRASSPPPSGKKIMGLPRTQFFLLAGVGAGLIVTFIIWRRKKASTAAAAMTATAGGCPDGSAPDANGNCPQSTDIAGELATLQTEIADLQAAAGAGGAAGGGSAGGIAGSTGTTSTPPSTGTPGGSSGATPSTPGQSRGWKFPAPTVQAYAVTKNGYRVRWNAVTGPSGQKPSSYTVQTWEAGKPGAVNEHISTQTDTAEYGPGGTGLKKGTYHTDVWPNGGPVAPPHGSTGNVTLTA